MDDEPKTWRAEAVGIEGEKNYRAACDGPQYDEIVRDLFRQWMRETNRSSEDLALSVRMDPKEIRAFMRGRPGTLDLLTRICAASGLTVDELMNLDEDYRAMTGKNVTSFKKALLSRLESMMTMEEIQSTYQWHELCRDLPEFHACLLTGMKFALDLADQQGLKTSYQRELIDKVWKHRVEAVVNFDE